MRGWSLVSGRRVLVALVVALLAGVSLSAGSAYANKTVTQSGIEKVAVVPFSCDRSTATPGFGTAQFSQIGNKLSVKFDFVNAPPHTSVDVELTQCQSGGPILTSTFGTATTNSKGELKGFFTVTLDSRADSYFLCLDGGFAKEWGTQPVPVA